MNDPAGSVVGKALSGTTVLDLTQVVSGSMATMMFADFGAEVIKVEPVGGETYRRAGYPLQGPGGTTNLNILRFSRGKKCVELDLKTEAGKEILAGLIAEADVLVENFRAGVLGRLGFPPDRIRELNPRLVYATISGFGHADVLASPADGLPVYALIAESMAGLLHLAGDADGAPTWMGFPMADIFSGMCAFAGCLVALRDRDRTGVGTRVDVGMFDAALAMNELSVAYQELVGETLGRGQYALACPWGPYPTSDGYVTIAVLDERQWHLLCAAIGRPDLAGDPALASGRDRSRAAASTVTPAIESWTRQRTKVQAAAELQRAGVPSAPVNTAADLVDSPLVHAREMYQVCHSTELGDVRLVGNPIKVLSSMPGGGRPHLPSLGEHTAAVLTEHLGATEEQLDRWVREGAIGRSAAPLVTAGAGDTQPESGGE